MGFILTIIGLLAIITGARGTYRQFGSMVAGEFQGNNNFLYFAAGIGAVGAVGYIDALRTFSRLFLALILIGIVVSNKGFFANLQAALKQGAVAPDPVPQASSASGGLGTATTQGEHESGLFGDTPTSSGQAKFNGWMNYFFGK